MYMQKSISEKLLEVIQAFNTEEDYDNLLGTILDKMMELTYSDAGTLYILDEDKLHFHIIKNNTFNTLQVVEREMNLPPIILDKSNIENVSAYCAIHNEIIIIDDVYTDNRFNFQGPKKYDEITGYRTCSMLVMPLISVRRDKVHMMGVIQLLNATNPETGEITTYGTVLDNNIPISMSRIATTTLANLKHSQEIEQLLRSFLAVITQAVDERSMVTRFHAQNVALYCQAFVEYLARTFPKGHKFHFEKYHRIDIVVAAMLHDIGKISTPKYILDKAYRLLNEQIVNIKYRFEIKRHQLKIEHLQGNITEDEYNSGLSELDTAFEIISQLNSSQNIYDKDLEKVSKLTELTYTNEQGEVVPLLEDTVIEAISVREGTLTPWEWMQMRDHVAATGRLLSRISAYKYFTPISRWARNHHEFLDGSGYPGGLTEKDLDLETCIITIMDIFEALISKDRPYKKAISPAWAITTLQEMANEGKLHKELVDAFVKSKIWERLARKK